MDIPIDYYRKWREAFPEPATPAQLQNLAELYGLVVEIHNGTVRLHRADTHKFVFSCLADSPIERYIARLAQWRRGQR